MGFFITYPWLLLCYPSDNIYLLNGVTVSHLLSIWLNLILSSRFLFVSLVLCYFPPFSCHLLIFFFFLPFYFISITGLCDTLLCSAFLMVALGFITTSASYSLLPISLLHRQHKEITMAYFHASPLPHSTVAILSASML